MKKRSFRSTFVSVILVITVAISIVNLAVYGINIKKIRQVEVLKMKTAGERIDDMITISLNNIKEALNALTFLYDLVVKDELSPNPAALTAMGKGADAMFRNQKVAMESAGLWMLPTYKENPLPFEWDVVRMPMDKNQNTKAGILNWGISKSTKNPEAAWDLLKFLCGPEGNRIVAESNMALPGSTDKEALQIVLDSKFPSNVKAFVDSVPDCDLKDQLSIYRTEVNTKVQQLVDEMLIGKSTPEETQEKLIKEINAILAN